MLNVDVGRDQRNEPCLEVPTAHGPPGIESHGELRGSQQDIGLPWFRQLDPAEHRLGPVPAPAQPQFPKSHVQPGLGLDQALEDGAMLRDPGESELVGQDDAEKETHGSRDADQPEPYPPGGL